MMENTVRVAMLIHSYYPCLGGAERILGALAPLLQKRGVEVHILTRRHPGLAPFETIDGVPVHRLPIPGPKPVASLSFTANALNRLRKLRPHLIHAHEMFSATTTAIAGKYLLGAPVVVTAHRSGPLGDVYRLQHKLFSSTRISLFRQKVDAFVAISQEIDSELAGIGIPAERRHAIPNGVDTEEFSPLSAEEKRGLRARLELPDVPIAIFAGRLAPEKRVNNLLAIWPAVRAAFPETLLLVLGAGSQEASLKQMAGEGVLFLGQRDDVASYLQAADVFVLPSIAEGLSVALIEALSTGLAVVATSVGGAPDIIQHKVNGWLIPPDDTPALEEAVLTLIGDPNYRRELSERGRKRVVSNFSLPAVATRLRLLYDQVLASQPRQQPVTEDRRPV